MNVAVVPPYGGDTAVPDYVARIARGLKQRGVDAVRADFVAGEGAMARVIDGYPPALL